MDFSATLEVEPFIDDVEMILRELTVPAVYNQLAAPPEGETTLSKFHTALIAGFGEKLGKKSPDKFEGGIKSMQVKAFCVNLEF